MKIKEGNISNNERVLRQVTDIIHTYKPNIDISNVMFELSSKGNWIVKCEKGKRICLISKFILPRNIAEELGLIQIVESVIDPNIKGLVDKNKIIDELKLYGLNMKDCIINDNGVVDVLKSVKINRSIEKFKVQFGEIKGSFDISDCKRLTTLIGCPDIVNGDFNCSNTNITRLQGAPDYITGSMMCRNCKRLISVKDSPIKVDNNIYITGTKVDVEYLKKVCKIGGDVVDNEVKW